MNDTKQNLYQVTTRDGLSYHLHDARLGSVILGSREPLRTVGGAILMPTEIVSLRRVQALEATR